MSTRTRQALLDFIGHKLYDLLVVGQANASANGRDVIEPSDLPITKGLQETIHRFRGLDEDVELRPSLSAPPRAAGPIDRRQNQGRLPDVVGGLSLALARTFVIVDPKLTNPGTAQGTGVPDLDLLL